MLYSYLQVLNPILCLMINILIQAIGFRYIKNLGLLGSVFLGFINGLIILFILEIYISFRLSLLLIDSLSLFIVNTLTYSLLGFCYFNFINLGETARRIRILRELYDSPKGLSLEEILERYNAKKIVEVRMHRLMNNGQIIYKDGKYYIDSPIMLFMAKLIVMMKLILLGKKETDRYVGTI